MIVTSTILAILLNLHIFFDNIKKKKLNIYICTYNIYVRT